MPLPDRAERAAARERQLKHQAKRNEAAFKANDFGTADPEAVKAARAKRKQQSASATRKAPGDKRQVPPAQAKSDKSKS